MMVTYYDAVESSLSNLCEVGKKEAVALRMQPAVFPFSTFSTWEQLRLLLWRSIVKIWDKSLHATDLKSHQPH